MSQGQGMNQQTAAEPSVKDILAGMANMNTTAAPPQKNYLGVPNDYQAMRPGNAIFLGPNGTSGEVAGGGMIPVAPRYYDGDEWRPANLPPDRIAETQRALVDAGLMTEKEYHEEMGSWGPKSVEAQARLLQNANATGRNADDAMATMQSAVAARGGPKKDEKIAQPLVVRLSRPEDIRSLANEVGARVLGRRLSDEQLEHHVAAWQQSERTLQEEQYRMTGSGLPGGPGGTVMDPLSQRGLEEKIKDENPQETASYDMVGRFDAFQSLLARYQ